MEKIGVLAKQIYCEIESGDVGMENFSCGAKINYQLHNIFPQTLVKINSEEKLTLTHIAVVIMNVAGLAPPLLSSDRAIAILCKEVIEYMVKPSLECVNIVFELIKQCVKEVIQKIENINRFPALRNEILRVSEQVLEDRRQIAYNFVECLVQTEISHIASIDINFRKSAQPIFEKLKLTAGVLNEGLEIFNLGEEV